MRAPTHYECDGQVQNNILHKTRREAGFVQFYTNV